MLLCLCPVGWLCLPETADRAETEQRQDTTKKNQSAQSYTFIMRKIWYHHIQIQNYLGFIVLILTYILFAKYTLAL